MYGPLDGCSTFRFENYLKELKSLIRKQDRLRDRPLVQVINRFSEKEVNAIYNIQEIIGKCIQPLQELIFKQPHTNGSLTANLSGPQYYGLIYGNININLKKEKDSYVLTNNNTLVKCPNICYSNSKPVLIGKFFESILPHYNNPLDSTLLNVYEVNNLSRNIHYWKISCFKKIMVLKNGKKLVVMPIIHSAV